MHFVTIANETIAAVEAARKMARLTQAELAKAVGMTQGHYSKLVALKVPAGIKALTALSVWIERAAVPQSDARSRQIEIKRLADDIAMQCMRLARLAADESDT